MTWYSIIAMETFESIWGLIKKGEGINTVQFDSLKECKEWAYEQYGPQGENIKIKIIEV